MQHVTCPKCHSEYDLKVVTVDDWRDHRESDVRCDVCRSVLSHQDTSHFGILIMTKHCGAA
jgi:hypothetical protein